MPMQPRPRAETASPLFPSSRVFMMCTSWCLRILSPACANQMLGAAPARDEGSFSHTDAGTSARRTTFRAVTASPAFVVRLLLRPAAPFQHAPGDSTRRALESRQRCTGTDMPLKELISTACSLRASDLHLEAGTPL